MANAMRNVLADNEPTIVNDAEPVDEHLFGRQMTDEEFEKEKKR